MLEVKDPIRVMSNAFHILLLNCRHAHTGDHAADSMLLKSIGVDGVAARIGVRTTLKVYVVTRSPKETLETSAQIH